MAGSHTSEERTVLDACAYGIHRKGPLKLEAIFIFLRKGAAGCITPLRKLYELVLGDVDGARPNQLKGVGSWDQVLLTVCRAVAETVRLPTGNIGCLACPQAFGFSSVSFIAFIV